MKLFSVGTTRTGNELWSFALPPGRNGTCIGATRLCDGFSYDKLGRPRYVCSAKRVPWPGARKKWHWIFQCTKSPAFVSDALWELRQGAPSLVRVHPFGDFYSADYAEKWLEIVRRRRQIRFWAYTRSWRVPSILPALSALSREPNFSLFWSTDAETHQKNGPPPKVKYVRVAHLRSSNNEVIPEYVDLIWKDKRGTVHPEPSLTACPQGIRSHLPKQVLPTVLTCTECGRCLIRRLSRRDRK